MSERANIVRVATHENMWTLNTPVPFDPESKIVRMLPSVEVEGAVEVYAIPLRGEVFESQMAFHVRLMPLLIKFVFGVASTKPGPGGEASQFQQIIEDNVFALQDDGGDEEEEEEEEEPEAEAPTPQNFAPQAWPGFAPGPFSNAVAPSQPQPPMASGPQGPFAPAPVAYAPPTPPAAPYVPADAMPQPPPAPSANGNGSPTAG